VTTDRLRGADAFVIFGLTGDLAYKMLIPALYALEARGELTVPVIGVARTDLDDDGLYKRVRAALGDAKVDVDDKIFTRLTDRLSLVAGSFDDDRTFTALKLALDKSAFPVFYLAVPPSLFATVAAGLADVGLADRSRLVVE
jgi:glucose-6-phosphate 1-dehydrogenase